MHAVFEGASRRSRRAGCLRFVATPLSSRRAIVASPLGSLALRFGATTFLLLGRCGRFDHRGNGCLHVVETRLQLTLKRRRNRHDRGQICNIDTM